MPQPATTEESVTQRNERMVKAILSKIEEGLKHGWFRMDIVAQDFRIEAFKFERTFK